MKTPTVMILVILMIWANLASAAGPVRRDPSSFSRPDEVRVEDVELDLAVDFGRKQLRGTATLTAARQPGSPPAAPLVLDTDDLTIGKVEAGANLENLAEVEYRLGKSDPVHGAPLTITLPEGAKRVRITYATAPGARALQWVEPSGTARGTKPFLFTQSQAIHARSWIPLQDTPGVRVTYKARIGPILGADGLKAVMSADGPTIKDGRASFAMPHPIPPYLIALAVGDLDSRPIGPRSRVWADGPIVELAASEFVDTEKMIVAAETICGPYRWSKYDILILPPSFPFGGMENATLTFATPTVLAGDRSLVSLVAHELSHSWAGNQVTCSTWADLWLNEGLTTYLERRIVEDLYGPERAAMEWVIGRRELKAELARLKPDDRILHIDLKGRDPEAALNGLPYEKGALFFRALEERFGRDRLDPYLKGYFDRFAFRSLGAADFERDCRAHLFPEDAPNAVDPIDLHAWLHEPGLPADAPEVKSNRLDALDRLARSWLDGAVNAEGLMAGHWSTQEWLHFLRSLPPRLSSQRMAELDTAYQLTDRQNAEIAAQWLLMAVRAGYAPADPRLERFLTSVGRRKYLMPLYTELIKTPAGRTRARALFNRARAGYHPIAAESIESLLNKKPTAD